MRIDVLLKNASERLTFASDTAQLDVRLLLAHVLAVSTSYLYTWPEKTVSDADFERFNSLLARRVLGEPVAYLLGHQAFWSLDIEVSPCTLIPRADTERLVEVALSVLDVNKASRILDLGTGTGAIALALATEQPRASVFGVDIVEDAVALAKRNALRNQLSNVMFMHSRWFDVFKGAETFDLIVSNPPYIDSSDEHLSKGDVRFEPKSALVADNHGLADIEHIINVAHSFMGSSAYLMFEHGYGQAEAIRERFNLAGYSGVESFQDLGGNDRVTIGKWVN